MSRRERRLFAIACSIACLIGALAGYFAYLTGTEQLMHGGVVPGNEDQTQWGVIRDAFATFAATSAIAAVVFTVILLAVLLWFRLRAGSSL